MDCEKINLLLIEYINEELSLEMNEIIKNHIKNCNQCNNTYRETKEMLFTMKDFSQSIPINYTEKNILKEELLKELRIYRAENPFLSGLHRKKKEITKAIKGKDIFRKLTGTEGI